jgi:prepilin-type N-terminal cleavage/methylation domain-containing protein
VTFRTSRRRRGFSLVEVITATAIFAIVMMLLSTLAISVGRTGRVNDYASKRNFALRQQAGWLQVLTFDEVSALTSGNTQMLLGDFTFVRRLAVTKSGDDRVTVKVVVGPVASEFKADSVTVYRTRPASGSPLCLTC